MRHSHFGIQRHVVAGPVPGPMFSSEHIFNHVIGIPRQAVFPKRPLHGCSLRSVRVQVDRNKQKIVSPRLDVKKNVVVLRGVETQVGQVLERGVSLPGKIQPRDQFFDVARRVPVALPELVFLAVEVFLPPGQGSILAQFKTTVDPVDRGERCGEHGTDHERGATGLLEEVGQDVRRVGEKVRAQVIRRPRRAQFGAVCSQLLLRVAPGEISVALGEAGLGQHTHHFRLGEGLAEKNKVGKLGSGFRNEPLPERHRLGVRIVDPEGTHPAFRPPQNQALQFAP